MARRDDLNAQYNALRQPVTTDDMNRWYETLRQTRQQPAQAWDYRTALQNTPQSDTLMNAFSRYRAQASDPRTATPLQRQMAERSQNRAAQARYALQNNGGMRQLASRANPPRVQELRAIPGTENREDEHGRPMEPEYYPQERWSAGKGLTTPESRMYQRLLNTYGTAEERRNPYNELLLDRQSRHILDTNDPERQNYGIRNPFTTELPPVEGQKSLNFRDQNRQRRGATATVGQPVNQYSQQGLAANLRNRMQNDTISGNAADMGALLVQRDYNRRPEVQRELRANTALGRQTTASTQDPALTEYLNRQTARDVNTITQTWNDQSPEAVAARDEAMARIVSNGENVDYDDILRRNFGTTVYQPRNMSVQEALNSNSADQYMQVFTAPYTGDYGSMDEYNQAVESAVRNMQPIPGSTPVQAWTSSDPFGMMWAQNVGSGIQDESERMRAAEAAMNRQRELAEKKQWIEGLYEEATHGIAGYDETSVAQVNRQWVEFCGEFEDYMAELNGGRRLDSGIRGLGDPERNAMSEQVQDTVNSVRQGRNNGAVSYALGNIGSLVRQGYTRTATAYWANGIEEIQSSIDYVNWQLRANPDNRDLQEVLGILQENLTEWQTAAVMFRPDFAELSEPNFAVADADHENMPRTMGVSNPRGLEYWRVNGSNAFNELRNQDWQNGRDFVATNLLYNDTLDQSLIDAGYRGVQTNLGRTPENYNAEDDWGAYMTDDQKRIYNYLYATEGSASAHQYLVSLTPYLEYQVRNERELGAREFAAENPIAALIVRTMDLPASAMFSGYGAITGASPNSTLFSLGLQRNIYGKTVGDWAEEQWPGFGRFASDAVGSIMDSTLMILLGSGMTGAAGFEAGGIANKIVQLIPQPLEAGGMRYQSLVDAGAPVEYAQTAGLISMGMEFATEYIGMEWTLSKVNGNGRLSDIARTAAGVLGEGQGISAQVAENAFDFVYSKLGRYARALFAGAFAEGLEEFPGQLAEVAFDLWYDENQSQIRQQTAARAAEMVEGGMDPEEANWRAACESFGTQMNELLYQMGVASASGGVSSMVRVAAGMANTVQADSKVNAALRNGEITEAQAEAALEYNRYIDALRMGDDADEPASAELAREAYRVMAENQAIRENTRELARQGITADSVEANADAWLLDRLGPEGYAAAAGTAPVETAPVMQNVENQVQELMDRQAALRQQAAAIRQRTQALAESGQIAVEEQGVPARTIPAAQNELANESEASERAAENDEQRAMRAETGADTNAAAAMAQPVAEMESAQRGRALTPDEANRLKALRETVQTNRDFAERLRGQLTGAQEELRQLEADEAAALESLKTGTTSNLVTGHNRAMRINMVAASIQTLQDQITQVEQAATQAETEAQALEERAAAADAFSGQRLDETDPAAQLRQPAPQTQPAPQAQPANDSSQRVRGLEHQGLIQTREEATQIYEQQIQDQQKQNSELKETIKALKKDQRNRKNRKDASFQQMVEQRIAMAERQLADGEERVKSLQQRQAQLSSQPDSYFGQNGARDLKENAPALRLDETDPAAEPRAQRPTLDVQNTQAQNEQQLPVSDQTQNDQQAQPDEQTTPTEERSAEDLEREADALEEQIRQLREQAPTDETAANEQARGGRSTAAPQAEGVPVTARASEGGQAPSTTNVSTRSNERGGLQRRAFPMTRDEWVNFNKYQAGLIRLPEAEAKRLTELANDAFNWDVRSTYNAPASVKGLGEVKLQGFESSGANPMVRVSRQQDGKTVTEAVPLSDVDFGPRGYLTSWAYERAAAYEDVDTARNYLAGFEATQVDPRNYNDAFVGLYAQQLSGTQMTPKQQAAVGMLESGVRNMINAAAQRGRMMQAEQMGIGGEASSAMTRQIQALPQRGTETRGYTGAVRDFTTALNARQRAYLLYGNELAKVSGLKITFTDKIGEYRENTADNTRGAANGFFRKGSNEVVIDITAMDGFGVVTSFHESWHFVVQESANDAELMEGRRALEKRLDGYLAQDPKFDMKKRVAQIQAKYKDVLNQDLKPEEAKEEIYANALMGLAANSAELNSVVEGLFEDKAAAGFFDRFIDTLGKWVRNLQNAVKRLTSPEARTIAQQDAAELSEAAKDFRALREAAGRVYAARTANGENVAREGGEARFGLEGFETRGPITYESLTSKPDMIVTRLNAVSSSATKSQVIDMGMQNAMEVGTPGYNGMAAITINDTGDRVNVSRQSIRHGFKNYFRAQMEIASKIGSVLKNSVLVNESDPEDNTTTGSDFYMGAAIKSDGRRQYALFTVNHTTRALEDIQIVHAMRANTIQNSKSGAVAIADGQAHAIELAGIFTAPDTISVAEALNDVKEEMRFDDILPINVMNRFGQKRRVTADNGRLRYSLDTEESTQPSSEALALENRINSSAESEKTGVKVDAGTLSAYTGVRLSLTTYNESEYVTDREKMIRMIMQSAQRDYDTVSKWFDDVSGIAATIAADKTRLDYTGLRNAEGKLVNSALKSNAEYGGSIDMSLICAKRRLMTGTIDAIQRRLGDSGFLTADEMMRIRNMLLEHDYQAACGLCYVESSRKNMGKVMSEFRQQFMAEHKNDGTYIPSMSDINTVDGLADLQIEHPDVYEALVKAMNKMAQRKPKMYESRTEYNGEILKRFANDDTVGAKNEAGGLRINSFSDFEIVHLIDMMQVIMDMSAVGLAGQAYTKVPEFAWALGRTGLKINLSLIAKRVGSDGRIVFDDVEGMNHEEAFKIRDAYSDNVGTILVVFSEKQLRAAVNDERIDFIIPFHRSQWKKSDYATLGLAKDTMDFTMHQNERWIHPSQHLNKNKKRTRPGNLAPNSYWDFTKSGRENAQRYLELCAETDRRPKFAKYLVDNHNGTWSLPEDGSMDGYWKLLIDFKMYNNEGEGRPQMPVVPDFNMEQCEKMLKEYKGGHESFPVADDVVEEFLQERGQRFGMKYSLSDESYMDAVDSGDMETAARMVEEAAKKAGYNQVRLYHGTRAFGFTSFDTTKSDDGISIFATDSRRTAETYSGETERSRINERDNTNVEDLHGQQLLDEAKKRLKKYSEYRLMTQDDKAEKLEETRKDIESAAQRAYSFINENGGMFNDEKLATADKALRSLLRLTWAETDDQIQEAYDEYERQMWELLWMDESVTHELQEAMDTRAIARAKNKIGDFVYNGDVYLNEFFDEYVFDNQMQLEIDAELHKGIYELYGDPGRQLVIDCKGANWNAIEAPTELNMYGTQRTRDIATAAKAAGYDSVLFRNLRDNGGETGYNGASDVYVFFNASSLKSADPVTYDDEGKVIPLSQRFNRENEDIRYSLSDESYMDAVEHGDTVKAGRMVRNAAQEAGVALDENGKPLKLYHGTTRFGFTKFGTDAIFLTTNSSVARGYSKFAGERSTSSQYVEDDGTDRTLIRNAKNVMDWNIKAIDQKDRQRIHDRLYPAFKEQADRMNAVESDYYPPEQISYAFWTVTGLAESMVENDNLFFNWDDPIRQQDAEDLIRQNSYDRVPEYWETLREYYREHKQEIEDAGGKAYWDIMMRGYEFGDMIIDFNTYLKLMRNNGGYVSTITSNDNVMTRDEVTEAIDRNRYRGVYTGYALMGDRPFEVDAKKAFWLSIEAPAIGEGTFTTDEIVRWAKAKGYTSVIIRNVMDPGIQNAYGDDYVVFNSSQFKSADPVTYDDDGKVIPLSQRFNWKEQDIRFSLSEREELMQPDQAVEDAADYIRYSMLEGVPEGTANTEIQRLMSENAKLRGRAEKAEAEADTYHKIAKTTNEENERLKAGVETARALRENAAMHQMVQDIVKQMNEWRSDNEIDDKQMSKLALMIRRGLESTVPYADIKNNLTNVFRQMAQAKTTAEAKGAIQALSDTILHCAQQSSHADRTMYDQYADARSMIKGLTFSEDDWSLLQDTRAGDWQSFRQNYFGRVKWTRGRSNIDSTYEELHEMYGEMFPLDLTLGDRLDRMMAFLDETEIQYYNPHTAENPENRGVNMATYAASDMTMQVLREFMTSGRPQTKSQNRMRNIERLMTETQEALQENRELRLNGQGAWVQAYRKQVAALRQELQTNTRGRQQAEQRAAAAETRATEAETRATAAETRASEAETRARDAERNAQAAAQTDARVKAAEARAEKAEEKAATARAEERAHQRDLRRRAAERRAQRETRQKMVNQIVRNYNSLMKKLEQPSSSGWVPTAMRDAVTKLLKALDFEGVTGSQALSKDLLEKAKAAYMSINRGEGPEGARGPMASYYNGDLEDEFDDLIASAVGKTAKQLSDEEVQKVRDIVAGFSAAVINADKLFTQGRRDSLTEAGDRMNEQSRERIRKYGEHRVEGTAQKWLSDALRQGLLKPTTVFSEYEGTVMGDIWHALRSAEDKHIRNIQAAEDFLQEMIEKYHMQDSINQETTENQRYFRDRKRKKSKTFELSSGRTVQLTDQELMTLYAWNKREANMMTNHLLGGGFTLKNQTRGGTMEEYKLTPNDLHKFEDALTDEQKAFADEMVEYLSTTCADWGNVVSEALYGIEKFTESYYLPFTVNKNYVGRDPGAAQDARLKVASFTKSLLTRAATTLELVPFTQLWASHVEQMSDYNAFALPIEDMTRVLNYRKGIYGEDGQFVGYGAAARPMMQRAWGKQSVEYIHSFLSRLNGNSRQEFGGGWINRFMSSAKGAAVTFNISVALQQAGAGIRALAEMDPRDVAVGLVKGFNFKRQYNELMEYAPIAVLKSWGYFDTNMKNGLYDRQRQTLWGRVQDAGGKMAGWGDEFNWAQIWNACKHEAKRLNPGMSEEDVKKAAAERFRDVIDRTQVVDSVFQRAEWATEKGMMKNVMAFMSEPITMYNMIYRNVTSTYRAIRSGDGRAAAVKGLTRNVAAIVLSAAMTAFLKSLATGLRDRDNDRKDEEGKTVGRRGYWDKVTDSFGANMLDNLMGVGTVFSSVIQDAIGTYRSSGGLTDAWVGNLLGAAKEALKGEDADWEKVWYKAAQGVSSLTGVGFSSLYRDGKAIIMTVLEETGAIAISSEAYDRSRSIGERLATAERFFCYNKDAKQPGQKVNANYYTDLLLETYLAGGLSDDFQAVADAAIRQGATERGLMSSFRTKLRAAEERVEQAAQALADGDTDEYNRLVAEMAEAGIGGNLINSMVTSAYNELTAEEETEVNRGTGEGLIRQIQAGTEDATVLSTRANTLLTETAAAADVAEAIRLYQEDGLSESQIRTRISNKFKKAYIRACVGGDTAEARRIRGLMLTAGSGIQEDDLASWTGADLFNSTSDTGLYTQILNGDADAARATSQWLYGHFEGGQQKVRERVLNWIRRRDPATYDRETVTRVLLSLGYSRETINGAIGQ